MNQADAVEIMLAPLPEFIQEYKKELHCSIISGGLIGTKDQMIRAIEKGAVAVSIGDPNLWKENIINETHSIPLV